MLRRMTTNMASSRAGFVALALALTLWWSPGISVQLSMWSKWPNPVLERGRSARLEEVLFPKRAPRYRRAEELGD